MPSWRAVDLYTGLGLSVAADVTCSVTSTLSVTLQFMLCSGSDQVCGCLAGVL